MSVPSHDAIAVSTSIDKLTAEVQKLRSGLEQGTLSIRTHHPLCSADPSKDYSIQQLETISKFITAAIATGALKLDPKITGGDR
jgi:hypothetical protein